MCREVAKLENRIEQGTDSVKGKWLRAKGKF